MAREGLPEAAERAFRKRRFAEAVEAFEEARLLGEDPETVHLRIAACRLFLGETTKAQHHFDRVLSRDKEHASALLGSAYLDLLAGRELEAIAKYTRLLSAGRHPAKIKKILAGLGKAASARDWALARPASHFLFGEDYPTGRGPAFRWIVLGAALLLVGGSASLLLLGPFAKVARKGGEGLRTLYSALPDRPAVTNAAAERMKGIYLYDLPNEDPDLGSAALLSLFEDTKKAIGRGEVNRAQRNVNRVLQSKANLLIKEKFRLLESAIPTPALSEFENTQPFSALVKDPFATKAWVKVLGRSGSPRVGGGLLVFDVTFSDPRSPDNETWTAECSLDAGSGVKIRAGGEYAILARFQGVDGARRKPLLSVVVLQEWVR